MCVWGRDTHTARGGGHTNLIEAGMMKKKKSRRTSTHKTHTPSIE